MRFTLALLRAAHFGPCVVVTLLASGLALAAGRGAGTVWTGAAVLAGQLSVGWSNDWLDAPRDSAAGRGDKPVAAGEIPVEVVRAGAVLALVAAVPLSVAAAAPGAPARQAAGVHLTAVGVAWVYNLGLKATIVSVLPYAVAFGLLPMFVALTVDGSAPWWMVTAAALAGAGAHFTNALPDLEVDARTGVQGLPHRLGRRGSVVASALLLGAAAGAVVVGRGGLGEGLAPIVLGVVAVLVTVVAVVGWRLGTRLAFTLTMAAALALFVLLVVSGPALG